jgi:hypothetical protein
VGWVGPSPKNKKIKNRKEKKNKKIKNVYA